MTAKSSPNERPPRNPKPIRVGVIGVGRGHGFAAGAGPHLGMELVALCDTWEERLNKVGKELGVTTYTDYDEFLEHDMDAVILANYFHQHAPFAVKALKAGKHVMSETAACFTLAQGVELIDTVEQTGKIYMFAENYPYMVFNQEMRRLYRAGKVGTFMYGEGEYVHPGSADFHNRISPGLNHWRNWIPATYYCTHSLAPIMFITETWPEKVNGFVMPYREDDPVAQRHVRVSDASSMIALRMNNGAVVKLLQVYLRGHGVWVRIHGSRGQMENLRQGDKNMVRLRREQYHEKRTDPEEQIYLPDFPEHHEKATSAGHGGGDFFMNFHFADAIRKQKPPFLDVYRGVAMSIVGPLAYRSALNDSNAVDIPDFRKESVRRQYADDHWSPDPTCRKEGDPPPSILGEIKPSDQALDYAKKVWKENGYTGE
ncbi:MAG: Gfo/Idh/MocA family oxidoreductase [Candidatus Pacebacteria bacterium]|nr:Gfo/Idh/MocA family oxidoreductase [Candidatus Paceibacterota bacterium]